MDFPRVASTELRVLLRQVIDARHVRNVATFAEVQVIRFRVCGQTAPDFLRINARHTRRNRTKQGVPLGLFREARGRDQHAPVAQFVAEDVPVLGGLSREAVDK